MAQIVCIDKDTVREGCEIDDIVAIHDDNVELTGPGYAGFKIIKVSGRIMPDIRKIFQPPEVKIAKKITEVNKWCFEEEKEVWNNSGVWCTLASRPKYTHSLKDLTETDIGRLEDVNVLPGAKDIILQKVSEKIHLNAENCVTETDLIGK